jgi:hypothetical protein
MATAASGQPFDIADVLKDVGPVVFDRHVYQDVLLQFKDRWVTDEVG